MHHTPAAAERICGSRRQGMVLLTPRTDLPAEEGAGGAAAASGLPVFNAGSQTARSGRDQALPAGNHLFYHQIHEVPGFRSQAPALPCTCQHCPHCPAPARNTAAAGPPCPACRILSTGAAAAPEPPSRKTQGRKTWQQEQEQGKQNPAAGRGRNLQRRVQEAQCQLQETEQKTESQVPHS